MAMNLKRKVKPTIKKKSKPSYVLGEEFVNPWLGTKIIEVLDSQSKRAGWVWVHADGKVVVSPHLGFYVWEGENGEKWTTESAALWLVKHRNK